MNLFYFVKILDTRFFSAFFDSQEKHKEVTTVQLLFSIVPKKLIKLSKTLMDTKRGYFRISSFVQIINFV